MGKKLPEMVVSTKNCVDAHIYDENHKSKVRLWIQIANDITISELSV